MENTIQLYHGSTKIIESPGFGKGNPHNDYGLGFYCTENLELATDFLSNAISLRQLSRAMLLGELGEQFMIKSSNAFNKLRYVGSEPVDGDIYFSKRSKRDRDAREQYLKHERKAERKTDDIYIINILNEEMKRDDSRIQKNIFI